MTWSKSIVEWTEVGTAFISVVFSWDLDRAYQKAVWYKSIGYDVKVGGPAIHNTTMFDEIAEVGGHIPDVVYRHNPQATFTTRGCPNKCPFCLVPKIEPEYVELSDFPIRPVVCDNNILASSDRHFDMVCEKLSNLQDVDFNQGLDARLLTPYKAKKISELNMRYTRLAFDSREYEEEFLGAMNLLKDNGISPRKITVYVLINFKESPEDALYRLEKVRETEAFPFPMRFQPLYARAKNSYIAKGWNERLIRDMMRYYSRLAYLDHIPFSEYNRYEADHKIELDDSQLELPYAN